MKKFFARNKLNIIVTILCIAVLLGIIIVGQSKFREDSKKLSDLLSQIQVDKKNTLEKTEVVVKDSDEKQVKPEKELVSYTGSNKIVKSNNLRWKSKNWYVLGDNITAAMGYQNIVKSACSMSSFVNDASIGRLMSDISLNVTSEKLKNIDVITVMAGTSDYSLSTPLGTIADGDNANTFYGNLHKTIKTLIAAKPGATIVFFTPLKRGAYKTYAVYPNPNSSGAALEDYVKAIKDVCQSYNILVYDLFNESGINEKNLKNYTTDNLNLNSAGNQRTAKLISDYLKTIN